jgi:hypothetical protein
MTSSFRPSDLAQKLPSGRDVILHVRQDKEEIEVRSPDGMLELKILLTPTGPVVQLKGGRLEIESSDAVTVNCQKFEVNAAQGIDLKSQKNINVDGDYVQLNCGDRTGYHDDPALVENQAKPKLLAEPRKPDQECPHSH